MVLVDGDSGILVELESSERTGGPGAGDCLVARQDFLPDAVQGELSTGGLMASLPKDRLEADRLAFWQRAARRPTNEFGQLVTLARRFEEYERRLEERDRADRERVRAMLGPDPVELDLEEKVRRWRIAWREWPHFAATGGSPEAPHPRAHALWLEARRAARIQSINDLRPDTTPIASSAELEATIAASPDTVEPYLVYGDFLQSRGDPRGELIALMAQPQRTPAVEAAIGRLLSESADYFLGTLPHYSALRLSWGLGFLRAAHVRRFAESGVDKRRLLEQLLDLPSARFLRVLTLVSADWGSLVSVVTTRRLPTLQRFYLAEQFEVDLTALPHAMPRVEELVIKAGAARLGPFALEHLRDLRLELGRLEDREVLETEWPALERLELTPGARLVLRIDPERMRNLSCIALRNPNLDADLNVVGMLGRSSLLEQVSELEVWACSLSESSARAILENADRFRHLRRLVLPSGCLGGNTIDRLRGMGPEIAMR